MPREEMPIFARTHDLLTWLLPATNHFPRAHRHTFTRRVLDVAFDLREHIERANHRRGPERLAELQLADEAMSQLKAYLRMAMTWHWISIGQYEHVSRMVLEVGRLLGGWRKVTLAQPAAKP